MHIPNFYLDKNHCDIKVYYKISFMYNKINVDPNATPCGTPLIVPSTLKIP